MLDVCSRFAGFRGGCPGRARGRVVSAVVGVLAITFAADAQPRAGANDLRTRWAADVDPNAPLPEYPRPAMVRARWLNLNGPWEFREGGDEPVHGQKLPETIIVPYPVESALSGIGRRMERCWYRKTFTVPADWAGKRLLLQFGAVDWEADVRINGHTLPAHKGGYDAFTFDITNWLVPEDEQEILVGVFDPSDGGTQPRGKQVNDPKGIFYTPTTGIWQTVWIEPVDTMYIHRVVLEPRPVTGVVRVHVFPAGQGVLRTVSAQVIDDGRVVANASVDSQAIVNLRVPDARLWSPEHPKLYEVVVNLQGPRGENDTVRSYFAFRTVEVKEDESGTPRILLNGEPVFQVGMLDQGFWPESLYTAPTDEALRFDIEQAKALGFNLLRKHVKVEPQRWYWWCDTLGMLVWQDMPSGDAFISPSDPDIARSEESAAQFERELKRMVQQKSHHPSIISWVLFNEGWGQYDTQRLTDELKALDPTRLVISASGWTDRGTGDVLDVHTYPEPRVAPPDETGRARVVGEFGGLGLPAPGHMWSDQHWGYQAATDGNDLTEQYIDLLQSAWAQHQLFGLSAAVYTQVSDVETECNGLFSYDRAVLKVDAERVRRANRGEFDTFAPGAASPAQWRFVTSAPPEGWEAPRFDDSAWSLGAPGFGTEGTPGAEVGTPWSTGDIWLRGEFTFDSDAPEGLWASIHHDEDAEVFINGVKAFDLKGYTTRYRRYALSEEARKAIVKGENVVAVHCRQTRGGQYIDVRFVRKAP